VEALLNASGIVFQEVVLGEVHLPRELTAPQQRGLSVELEKVGFELINSQESLLIERIKQCIRELVYTHDAALKTNLSTYLSDALNKDYSLLSNLFSQVEGTTIEKFFIAQKTERVKELIVYDELTISEIADLLHYSSAAHLSNQFKAVTGLSPSAFRGLRDRKRRPIDEL